MPNQTDKNILKQYFRSGSRHTQKQFHELIDSCYNNDAFTSFVSGYQLLVNNERDDPYSTLVREGGRTVLVPFFDRINIAQQRIFHYAIPVSNIGQGFIMDRLILEIDLPENTEYSVQDKRKEVRITQNVNIELINIYNGSEEIFSTSPKKQNDDPVYEIEVGEAAGQWSGIAVDIVVSYDIKSDIAISDQLDISREKGDMLEHSFGSAGCIFTQSN